MPTPIVFWGATGQALVLAELLSYFDYELLALFDNNAQLVSPIRGVPLKVGWSEFEAWRVNGVPLGCQFLVAVGGHRGAIRLEVFEKLKAAGLAPTLAIHPTAFVSKTATLGPGCQLLMRATIGANAQLGHCTIVNSNASVDHECVLGNGVHVAPGATLCGCVVVEDAAFIGAGAVILPRLTIGHGSIVGAGAVVTRNVPPGVVVAGNPARIHSSKE